MKQHTDESKQQGGGNQLNGMKPVNAEKLNKIKGFEEGYTKPAPKSHSK